MHGAELYDAVRRTNARTRALVSHYGADPVWSSRVYLLNAVTRALVLDGRDLDDPEARDLVALANLLVLDESFPGDPLTVAELRRAGGLPLWAANRLEAAQGFIRGRRTDGSLRDAPPRPHPGGAGAWRSLENRPPVRPGWGRVQPFGAVLPAELGPPPEPGSAEHRAQLARVREAATEISPEELAIVLRWACSIGSEGPAGQWQAVLESELIRLGDFGRALSALTVAEVALFNAGIACWRTKFEHWYPRPSNVEGSIPLHIHLPNFPSYTSGHSTFSWSVVGCLDEDAPGLRAAVADLATEASWSRVLAGVHYPSDCDGGKELGLLVGAATADALRDLPGVVAAAQEEVGAVGAH